MNWIQYKIFGNVNTFFANFQKLEKKNLRGAFDRTEANLIISKFKKHSNQKKYYFCTIILKF